MHSLQSWASLPLPRPQIIETFSFYSFFITFSLWWQRIASEVVVSCLGFDVVKGVCTESAVDAAITLICLCLLLLSKTTCLQIVLVPLSVMHTTLHRRSLNIFNADL
jgi:hypothetical protein